MRRQIMNELKLIIKAVTKDAQKSLADIKKELQGISKEAAIEDEDEEKN